MNNNSSLISKLSPIFLFSNWRTGGTALAMSFRELSQFYLYTEPLNPSLKNKKVALNLSTSGWNSKHPPDEIYFSEFKPLLNRPDFFFPNLKNIPYVLGPDDSCDDLFRYISQLINFAHEQGKAPVFKFEQLEGAAPWIANKFPGSLSVGVTRDPLYQLISWMEQLSIGNDSFFKSAHQLIQRNLEYFGSDSIEVKNDGDIDAFKKIFDVFRQRIDIQHSQHMNFCIDIAPETTESKKSQLEIIAKHDAGRLIEWEQVLRKVRLSIPRSMEAENALSRLSKISLLNSKLSIQEKSIIKLGKKLKISTAKQEEDMKKKIEENEDMQDKLDRIHQSTSWQITAPLRQVGKACYRLGNFITDFKSRFISQKLRQLLRLLKRVSKLRIKSKSPSQMQDAFQKIFVTNHWRSEVSHSGGGSDLTQTKIIRNTLPKLIKKYKIKKMLDVPCGDFYWMSQVDFGPKFQYFGADVVPELIENNKKNHNSVNRDFIHLDVSRDDLPNVDLIFCRDLLVHFSYEDVIRTLANFKRSGAIWLLTTTFTDRASNEDIVTGDWRTLNFKLHPFNFPEPKEIIIEGCTEFDGLFSDKTLALWRLDDV